MTIDRSKQIEDFLAKLPDVKPHRPNRPVGLDEKIYTLLMDLNRFYEDTGREPSGDSSIGFEERSLAIRLTRLRNDYHDNPLVREVDIHGLVSAGTQQEVPKEPTPEVNKEPPSPEPQEKSDTAPVDVTPSPDALDVVIIPDDDDLATSPGNIDAFLDKIDDGQTGIFNLKNVRSSSEKVNPVDYVAQRVHCPNFHEFEPLFEEITRQLEQGIRETIPFRKEYEIEQGQFFILNGVMVYIAEVGDEYEKNGKKNARMRVIFSNGTEGDNLKRSLASELYKDATGRRITDPKTEGLFSNMSSEDDIGTGTIYVLKSQSEHPRISPIRNYLHKIGVTKGSVKTRIANAENDPTYLLADVQVVAEFKIYNVKASKIEKLLQAYFDKARADITIEDRFGKPVRSTEWFFVLPNTIKEAVDRLIDGSLGETYYDPKQAKIRLFDQPKD